MEISYRNDIWLGGDGYKLLVSTSIGYRKNAGCLPQKHKKHNYELEKNLSTVTSLVPTILSIKHFILIFRVQ